MPHPFRLILARRVTEFIFICLAQGVALQLCEMSPDLWPAAGLATALIFIRGWQIWPGLLIATGAFFWGSPLATWVYWTFLFTGIPLLLVFFYHRWAGAYHPLKYWHSFLKFSLLAGIASLPYEQYWMPIFSGILLFTPPIVLWNSWVPKTSLPYRYLLASLTMVSGLFPTMMMLCMATLGYGLALSPVGSALWRRR